MDPLSQLALGAAVGQVTLGRRVGRRALLWGAVLAGLPDLDVLIPYADAVATVTEHRGFSHSLLVHAAAAPAVGWALARLHRGAGARALGWGVLAWLAFATHALLDACTVYGTQLLWPLPGPPIGLGNVFIIDPAYTLPLLATVIWALTRGGDRRAAVRICAIGLAISTGYLALTAGLQHRVQGIAETAARAAGLPADRVLVTPAPFNAVLWRIVAMYEHGYAEGYYSFLDETPTVEFARYPSDEGLLAPIENTYAVRRLRWFTRGYLRVTDVDGAIVVADLRMGYEPRYVFSYVVGQRGGERILPVTARKGPIAPPSIEDLPAMWDRLRGR